MRFSFTPDYRENISNCEMNFKYEIIQAFILKSFTSHYTKNMEKKVFFFHSKMSVNVGFITDKLTYM